MKQISFYVLLLALLTACVSASAPGGYGCNEDMALCINVTAEEPIAVGEPVVVTITVSGEKDTSELVISLERASLSEFSFEDPISKTWKQSNGTDWKVDFQADQPLSFTGKVLLPIEEGIYTLVARAFSKEYGSIVETFIKIYITGNEAKVYYPGTEIPITEGPLPTSSPGPIPITQETTPILDNATPNLVATEQFIPLPTVVITLPPGALTVTPIP